jgi:hypothetical protein
LPYPFIQSELLDDDRIKLSGDAIEEYIRRYQAMLAARQQDAESLRRHYESASEIILCIDGLQPCARLGRSLALPKSMI